MRRLCWPMLGALLVVGGAGSAHAQGLPVPQALIIQEPRPSPVLPIALVPFTIGTEVCRNGHQPVVAFKVYNVLGRPEATLWLRSRRLEKLDSLSLRCGSYVAIWDGTIDDGQRTARPGIYYLRLTVDDRRAIVRQVRVP